MKINVTEVRAQLIQENRELTDGLSKVYELTPDLEKFITNLDLRGQAYDACKEHFMNVSEPLVQAINCMLEAKYNGNSKYLNAINAYLSGLGKVDLEVLQSSKENLASQVAKLESNDIVAAVSSPYIYSINLVQKNIDEKIEKMENFLAATVGCYDDYNEKILIVAQGIAAAKELAFDTSTSSYPSIQNVNMQWVTQVNNINKEKNEAYLQAQYGDFIEENPTRHAGMYIIAEYERFHIDDTNKYNKFLEPLNDTDTVEIKIITYNAEQLYRDLLFKYIDNFDVKLQQDGTSYFWGEKNAIFLTEGAFSDDNYQTFFHEIGHGIDYYYSRENRLKEDISRSYIGSNGLTLDQAAIADLENWSSENAREILEKEHSELTSTQIDTMVNNITEYIMSGGNGSLGLTEEMVLEEMQYTFSRNNRGRSGSLVSDVGSGISNFVLKGEFSHINGTDDKGTYWLYNDGKVRRVPSLEYFAEYYGYNMTKEEKGLNGVASVFPGSQEVIDEMLEKMGQ